MEGTGFRRQKPSASSSVSSSRSRAVGDASQSREPQSRRPRQLPPRDDSGRFISTSSLISAPASSEPIVAQSAVVPSASTPPESGAQHTAEFTPANPVGLGLGLLGQLAKSVGDFFLEGPRESSSAPPDLELVRHLANEFDDAQASVSSVSHGTPESGYQATSVGVSPETEHTAHIEASGVDEAVQQLDFADSADVLLHDKMSNLTLEEGIAKIAQAVNPRSNFKFPEFTGNEGVEQGAQWLNTFETQAAACSLTDQEKIQFFPTALQGPAKDWYTLHSKEDQSFQEAERDGN